MIGRRVGRGGRPGLIGVAARTAVVAGTATAVSGRVAARQQQSHAAAASAAQEASAPVAPVAATGEPVGTLDEHALSSLERLASLHTQGMLTDEEFATAKQRVLGS